MYAAKAFRKPGRHLSSSNAKPKSQRPVSHLESPPPVPSFHVPPRRPPPAGPIIMFDIPGSMVREEILGPDVKFLRSCGRWRSTVVNQPDENRLRTIAIPRNVSVTPLCRRGPSGGLLLVSFAQIRPLYPTF